MPVLRIRSREPADLLAIRRPMARAFVPVACFPESEARIVDVLRAS
jgi:predicted N-acetyltransferase YhbS